MREAASDMNRLAETSPVPPPAQGQPRRLVPVGRRGARPRPRGGQADPRLDRLRRLPLVPRDGARVLRGPAGRRADERALRLHQGRPRGAPGRRRDLHGRGAGAHRPRRLAAQRLPHAGRRAVLRRHLLPARAAPRACRRGRRSSSRVAEAFHDAARRGRRHGASGSSRAWPAPRASSRRRASSTRTTLRAGASPRCARATTGSTAASRRARRSSRPRPRSSSCSPAASARWRCTRCGRWPAAACTTRSAAASPATRSTRAWVIPHFEKMLYDNALLARAYLHGYQVSGEPLFERVTTETLDWALRDLRQDGGRLRVLARRGLRGRGGALLRLDARRDAGGRRRRGRRLLRARRPAQLRGQLGAGACRARPGGAARRSRRALREAREQRVWPGLDDKRLTAWNALMISALADAGGALERPDYVDAAVACAEFVLARPARRRGPPAADLQPRPRAARRLPRGPRVPARGAAHALRRDVRPALVRGGARARGDDPRPLRRRASTAASSRPPTTTRRWSPGARSSRTRRSRPAPSSAAFGLLRLAALTGEHRYEAAAEGALRLLHGVAPQYPSAFGHVLQALDFHLAAVKEVAIVGPGRRSRSSAWSAVRSARTWCSRAARPTACRCSRAAIPSTAAPRRTSASASPAGGR